MKKSAGKPLYFLHIAKTAGTSLTALLDSHFKKEEIAPFSLTHQLSGALKKDKSCLEHYALLRGHMGYSPILLMKKKPEIITLLREPLSRTLSHYEHILRHKDHWIHPLLPKKNPTLEEFLDFPRARLLLTNFQTRNLAQDFDFTAPILSDGGAPLEPNLGRLLAYVSPRLSDKALLSTALKRLKSFALVGTTETFRTFVEALCSHRGWQIPSSLPEHNTAPKESADVKKLSPRLRAELEDITTLDKALHEEAIARIMR